MLKRLLPRHLPRHRKSRLISRLNRLCAAMRARTYWIERDPPGPARDSFTHPF